MMKTLSPDTHPEAERVQIEMLRQMPSWRKLQLIGEMTRTCQVLALSGLRQRHPDETPEELRLRLAVLMLGRETATRVYGQVPE
jgi:hypothetical protein